MDQSAVGLASFWHGDPLTALETACLASFVQQGYDVTVYGYDKLEGLPDGVQYGDAREIVDQKYLFAFKVLGKPSLSHFSDLFRYQLFSRVGKAWIDSDLLCLRKFVIPPSGNFFAKEAAAGINGAIMRIDPQDARLARLIDLTLEYASGGEFAWGSTGPALVTKAFGQEALAIAQPIERFYPIHWTEWWKPFLPEEREWCVAACRNTDALHLWNNIVERSGYWKSLAPPEGSFLHACLQEQGLLHYFADVCPVSVMRRLVESDINLRTGRHHKLGHLASLTLERASVVLKRRLGSKA